jgi:hypothetical protein
VQTQGGDDGGGVVLTSELEDPLALAFSEFSEFELAAFSPSLEAAIEDPLGDKGADYELLLSSLSPADAACGDVDTGEGCWRWLLCPEAERGAVALGADGWSPPGVWPPHGSAAGDALRVELLLCDGPGDLAGESASDRRISGSVPTGECSAESSSCSASGLSISERILASFSAAISSRFSV